MTDPAPTSPAAEAPRAWPATEIELETLREAADLIEERVGQGCASEVGFYDDALALHTAWWLRGEYTGLKALPGWVALTQDVIADVAERSGREYVRLVMARDAEGRLQYRSDTLAAASRVAQRVLELS